MKRSMIRYGVKVRRHKVKGYEYPTIPLRGAVMKEAGFGIGDLVDVGVEEGRIVVSRATASSSRRPRATRRR